MDGLGLWVLISSAPQVKLPFINVIDCYKPTRIRISWIWTLVKYHLIPSPKPKPHPVCMNI